MNAPHPVRPISERLPRRRDLYYGGAWHEPRGSYLDTVNPATGESLGRVAEANAEDVDAAVRAAQAGFETWRRLKPLERAGLLRKVAAVLRENAFELAMIDAANCGNPISEMQRDALIAAVQIEYYAGLATEIKGETLPMGEGILNYCCASLTVCVHGSSPTTIRSCSLRAKWRLRWLPATWSS